VSLRSHEGQAIIQILAALQKSVAFSYHLNEGLGIRFRIDR